MRQTLPTTPVPLHRSQTYSENSCTFFSQAFSTMQTAAYSENSEPSLSAIMLDHFCRRLHNKIFWQELGLLFLLLANLLALENQQVLLGLLLVDQMFHVRLNRFLGAALEQRKPHRFIEEVVDQLPGLPPSCRRHGRNRPTKHD